MQTDASLQVSEQRSYSFDEGYSIIAWHVPGIEEGSSINISDVRALRANEEGKSTGRWRKYKEVSFNTSWRNLLEETQGTSKRVESYFEKSRTSGSSDYTTEPKAKTYSYDATNECIYIFPGTVKRNTVYECNYTISNAVQAYDDIAEMYWTYSLPESDEGARNLRMKVQIPVPEDGKVLPYENVYAWGHAPDGSVEIRDDGVIDIKVSKVDPGQYAEVHIAFPRSWLRNVGIASDSYKAGTRLGYAIAEEDGWIDYRSAYEANRYMLAFAICVVGLVSLVMCGVLYMVFGRERDASKISSLSNEDVGSIDDYSPAVCGRLLRWNHHSAYDLAYVLQVLNEAGVIQISSSPDAGKTRLRLTPSSKMADLDAAEKGALSLLFDTIGDGYQSISIDDIREYCRREPDSAFEAMSKWQRIVSAEVEQANLFDKKSKTASRVAIGISVFMLLVGIFSVLVGVMAVACVISFCVAVACAVIAYALPRRTDSGLLLADRLEASGFSRTGPRPIWEAPLANAFGEALSA